MDPALSEWLNLLVRWFHVIAGIMWIGSSIFFNWLDSSLERPDPPDRHLQGRLWMVHSGGFYDVRKVHLEPGEVPATIHWFYWEATFTWISGILLLGIVYYLDTSLLVDPSVRELQPAAAIGLGVGLLVVSWFLYDGLWQSPVPRGVATALSLAYLAGVSWGLCQLYSGRGAFIHVGAMMGTCMVANVWRRILPAQTQMLAATREGREADWSLGEKAKTRSRHNNYMTFPVIFVMISNHFPTTWAGTWNWAILLVLFLASMLVKHFMNISDRFRAWIPASAATAVVAILALWLVTSRPAPAATGGPASFAEAHAVIVARCQPCHSVHPTDAAFPTAPLGVTFDTAAEMKAKADRIKFRAVDSRTMPLAKRTGITDAERDVLGRWVSGGAPIE